MPLPACEKPEEGAQEGLRELPGAGLGREQLGDIGEIEPEFAVAIEAEIESERPRQHDRIDAARRRPGDDIDDDAQRDRLADRLQKREIDVLGVPLAAMGDGSVIAGLGPRRLVLDGVIGARGAHELQNLARDPVHVDGKRDPAVADQGQPQFALAQRVRRARLRCGPR